MKRTNSRIIKLPSIIKVGGKFAKDLSKDEIEELNARSYDYGKRTAIPTLYDYVIEPFNTTFKERVFTEAVKKVGLNPNGILNDNYSIDEVFNDKKFFAIAYPTQTSKYGVVLSLIKDFLGTVIKDNIAGVSREGVRKIENNAYIFVDYLLEGVDRFKNENTTRFNKKDLKLKDPKTDKELPLDEKIEKMRVYFGLKRFSNINAKTADGFYDTSSLKSRIVSFLEAFEQKVIKRFGVSSEGLEESQAFDYELSDGSAIRYLFFPRPSTEHGEIYSGLVGKETKNIARSTGDLDIVKELAFKKMYEYIRGGKGVRVTTELTDKAGKKGKIKILRLSKDGTQEERIYSVFNSKGRPYVKVNDILDTLEMLTKQHTTDPTKLKIDLFAAPPAYLR